MTTPIYRLPAHLLAPIEGQRLHLTDLSPQILLMISEYVNTNDIDYSYGATKTLQYTGYDINHNMDRSVFHLSQCSRPLRNITKPIRYRRFKEGSKSLPKFMCRVLENPDLGEFTWFFQSAIADEDESYDTPMDMSYVQEADWVRIQAAIKRLSSDGSDAQEWVQELRNGVWDAGIPY